MRTEVSLHVKTGGSRSYAAAPSPVIRLWKAHVQIREADHAADLGERVDALGGANLQRSAKRKRKLKPRILLFIILVEVYYFIISFLG